MSDNWNIAIHISEFQEAVRSGRITDAELVEWTVDQRWQRYVGTLDGVRVMSVLITQPPKRQGNRRQGNR